MLWFLSFDLYLLEEYKINLPVQSLAFKLTVLRSTFLYLSIEFSLATDILYAKNCTVYMCFLPQMWQHVLRSFHFCNILYYYYYISTVHIITSVNEKNRIKEGKILGIHRDKRDKFLVHDVNWTIIIIIHIL
jgi:hypothetical protein